MPMWLSIVPPVLALALAFAFREVYTALFLGVVSGAVIVEYYGGAAWWSAPFLGLARVFDTYLVDTLAGRGHVQVILFLVLIGATVSIISLNGGMRGLIERLSHRVNGPQSAQVLTFVLNMLLFFDGYANTLVAGSMVRPLPERTRVSREKFAFIVDSAAAPVCALSFITTWIGAELTYIEEGIAGLGLEESAYSLFMASLPYRFYPILMLVLVVMVIWTGRDYGPMLRAERCARRGEHRKAGADSMMGGDVDIEPAVATPARAYNALIPIAVLVLVTVGGVFVTGYSPAIWGNADLSLSGKLMETVGASDSYIALVWATAASTLVAFVLTVATRTLRFAVAMDALVRGVRLMLPALIILALAWSLALMTKVMHTADFISSLLMAWDVSPFLLPAITFLLASLIAVSTGTSWGTMAILYPLVLPVSWHLAMGAGMGHGEAMDILLNVVSCILAGAVVGDHCSPISDTTIMSSTATGCDHLSHVRTQLPYALTVGGVSLLCGIIPATLGVSPWLLLLLDVVLLYGILRFVGKRPSLA